VCRLKWTKYNSIRQASHMAHVKDGINYPYDGQQSLTRCRRNPLTYVSFHHASTDTFRANDDSTTCMRVCAEKADCTTSAGSKGGGKRFKVNGRSDHLRAGVRLGASVSVHSDRLIDLDTCLPAGMQAPRRHPRRHSAEMHTRHGTGRASLARRPTTRKQQITEMFGGVT